MSDRSLAVIVLDAADEALIDRFSAQGMLPALSAFRKSASYREIGGPHLLSEIGAWASVWSGVSPAEHGYYGFRALRPGSYDLQLCNARSSGVRPFWADGRKRRSLVFDLAEVFPDPEVDGLQVSYWRTIMASNAPVPCESMPADLAPRILKRYGPRHCIEHYCPHWDVNDVRKQLRVRKEMVAAKGQAFREMLADGPFDFIGIGFADVHSTGHAFWDYHVDTSHPVHQALGDMYSSLDSEFGRVLEALPDSASVIVLAAYGLKPEYPTTDLPGAVLRMLGYQPSHESGPAKRSWRDMLPMEWRKQIGSRLPVAMQERLIAAGFRESADWRRTTAFAVPGLYSSYIQINLAGREPQGIVQPGPEYDEILGRICRDFEQLMDPVSNTPAVEKIYRTHQLHGGEPPRVLPDLIVSWAPRSHMLTHLTHPQGEVRVSPHPYARSTYHSYKGWMMVRGANPPGQSTIDLLDLAPWMKTLLPAA